MAYASTDTVLLTEDLGDLKVVKSVPDRPNTFRAQTPQSFRFATIRHAYDLLPPTRTSIPPTNTQRMRSIICLMNPSPLSPVRKPT